MCRPRPNDVAQHSLETPTCPLCTLLGWSFGMGVLWGGEVTEGSGCYGEVVVLLWGCSHGPAPCAAELAQLSHHEAECTHGWAGSSQRHPQPILMEPSRCGVALVSGRGLNNPAVVLGAQHGMGTGITPSSPPAALSGAAANPCWADTSLNHNLCTAAAKSTRPS